MHEVQSWYVWRHLTKSHGRVRVYRSTNRPVFNHQSTDRYVVVLSFRTLCEYRWQNGTSLNVRSRNPARTRETIKKKCRELLLPTDITTAQEGRSLMYYSKWGHRWQWRLQRYGGGSDPCIPVQLGDDLGPTALRPGSDRRTCRWCTGNGSGGGSMDVCGAVVDDVGSGLYGLAPSTGGSFPPGGVHAPYALLP